MDGARVPSVTTASLFTRCSPLPHSASTQHARQLQATRRCMTARYNAFDQLQVQPSVPAQSAASLPPQSCSTQHQAAKAPNRSLSAPAQSLEQSAKAAVRGLPDCFQSLSGLQPGVMSACSNSSLGTPGGAPSLASAAANAATADAVRPFIRGGYSYMSKCATHIFCQRVCFINSKPSGSA